jgi:hypothetical protein
VKSLARVHTESAIRRIEGLAENAQDEGVKLAANKTLLDRGWGAPTQKHKHGGDEEGAPLRVNLVYRTREKK